MILLLIKQWYEQESEGYANLGNKNKSKYSYGYHIINKVYGFIKLENNYFENVLGFGSAWGYEFDPIIMKIKNLTIIEPSDQLRNDKIDKLIPKYVKPEIDGSLKFKTNSFDLITCFGTLHHIPNVSFVLRELIRVLKPNGYILLREPIISMGDWNFPRKGLTKNERGIPIKFFDNIFKYEPVDIISREFCFTATNFIQKTIGRLLKKSVYSYKSYVVFDKLISFLLKGNVHYHAEKMIHRIAPSSIFYIIKKLPPK
jgi:SAM-dependent methyltransferase